MQCIALRFWTAIYYKIKSYDTRTYWLLNAFVTVSCKESTAHLFFIYLCNSSAFLFLKLIQFCSYLRVPRIENIRIFLGRAKISWKAYATFLLGFITILSAEYMYFCVIFAIIPHWNNIVYSKCSCVLQSIMPYSESYIYVFTWHIIKAMCVGCLFSLAYLCNRYNAGWKARRTIRDREKYELVCSTVVNVKLKRYLHM